MSRTARGYALVLLAAILWASLGLFYKQLLDGYGLSALTIAFFRALLTALILLAAHLIAWALRARAGDRRPGILSIPRRDLVGFAIFGLVGVAAFYGVYAGAIDRAGMGIAAVLMYTAPAWVTAISVLFLGERLTGVRAAALGLAVVGAALVARIYEFEALRLNPMGVLLGLGAGLTYGLYTLFSKIGLRRYSAWAVLTYALSFGAVFMLPFQSFAALATALTTPAVLGWLLAIALIPTLLAGVSFNLGLRDLPASNASITATLEPFIAIVLGGLFLGERLDWGQWVGGSLILGAVILLSTVRAAAPDQESGPGCPTTRREAPPATTDGSPGPHEG